MFKAQKYGIETSLDLNWHDLMSKTKAKRMVKKSLKDGRKILKFLK